MSNTVLQTKDHCATFADYMGGELRSSLKLTHTSIEWIDCICDALHTSAFPVLRTAIKAIKCAATLTFFADLPAKIRDFYDSIVQGGIRSISRKFATLVATGCQCAKWLSDIGALAIGRALPVMNAFRHIATMWLTAHNVWDKAKVWSKTVVTLKDKKQQESALINIAGSIAGFTMNFFLLLGIVFTPLLGPFPLLVLATVGVVSHLAEFFLKREIERLA